MTNFSRSDEFLRLSDGEIERLFEEDIRFGDLTTRALGIGDQPGRMSFTARQDMVLCGSDEASRLLSRLGVHVTFTAKTGSRAAKGSLLLAAEGSAAMLHMGWKIAQTMMEWASGIATMTHEIVLAANVGAVHIPVLCTRKSIPFTRQLSLKAVIAGGGEIHRLGLSDTIMLFAEHRAFLDKSDDIKNAVMRLKARVPERAVMVEVTSEADAWLAAEALADVIQLEKFEPAAVQRIVKQICKRSDNRPLIAVAGGIGPKNAADYVRAGTDTIVTSAPFYAKPQDIQVRIEKL
ncbi:MAG: ModD protein [Acidiphilium sp.]|nr:ModD protein [Acidiphilium sp.]MDD4935155.1 ModD protein [Acidiphilium sp.]